MERRDGTTFDCNIPNFSLESTTDSDPPHGFVVGNWIAVITNYLSFQRQNIHVDTHKIICTNNYDRDPCQLEVVLLQEEWKLYIGKLSLY